MRKLPPTLAQSSGTNTAEVSSRKQEREQRDAQVRGVSSLAAMRQAVIEASRHLPTITEIARVPALSAQAFRAQARTGLPFLMNGIVERWPLTQLPPSILRERFAHVPVRARVGDYIDTAFAHDRAMQDMHMGAYLDLVESGTHALPPYLGNLALRELNPLCHWPAYFDKMGPPRYWIGPAATVTPLHADYDDNIFAQIWGSKQIFLAPPHHADLLYPREANALLFGSPIDPLAPDYQAYPLARHATLIEVVVNPGDMLYVPAGWFHYVRALSFSLSSNRWARVQPLVLPA